MHKGLRMTHCTSYAKPIWRKNIECWCFGCRKFYSGLVIGIDEGIGKDICKDYMVYIEQKEKKI